MRKAYMHIYIAHAQHKASEVLPVQSSTRLLSPSGLYATCLSVHPFLYIHRRKPQLPPICFTFLCTVPSGESIVSWFKQPPLVRLIVISSFSGQPGSPNLVVSLQP